MSYEIKNVRNIKRLRTENIIITQAKNLCQENYLIDPSIMLGNYHYTWGKWQEYFYRTLTRFSLPNHFFVELLDKDYVIYNGLGINQKSYYIEDLARFRIIPDKFRNSILITIQEDFTKDGLDRRMLEHLCDKLITPLMLEYKIDVSRVKYIDDILTTSWEDNMKVYNLDYTIEKALYYDSNLVESFIRKYLKK